MDRTGELVISIEEWQNWKIIHFTGTLIVNFIPIARKRFDEIEAGTELHIAADLTGVTSIDSSILSMLLNLDHRLRERGGMVVIIGPGEKIMEPFFRTCINDALPVFSSRPLFEQSACEL